MSRGLSAAMLSAIAAGQTYPIFFAYFDFTGGVIRVCTDNRQVTWNALTWSGLGDLCTIEPIRDTKSTRANGMSFGLNGIKSTLITEIIANRSRGRTVTMWHGLYNSSRSLLADPQQRFSGRMDQPVIQDSGETCNVTVRAESRLSDLQRVRESRYTDEDQQMKYPGDLGLQYVAGLQMKDVPWGPRSNPLNPSSGGGSRESPNRVYAK